jgi:hypothetical protein
MQNKGIVYLLLALTLVGAIISACGVPTPAEQSPAATRRRHREPGAPNDRCGGSSAHRNTRRIICYRHRTRDHPTCRYNVGHRSRSAGEHHGIDCRG